MNHMIHMNHISHLYMESTIEDIHILMWSVHETTILIKRIGEEQNLGYLFILSTGWYDRWYKPVLVALVV